MRKHPSKYARENRKHSPYTKYGSAKTDAHHARISGEARPVVGDSLVALELKLAQIKPTL